MTWTERRIYADHAATSHPKPGCVAASMMECLTEIGASPGRGAYAEAHRAGEILRSCRERVHRLIGGAGGAERVVFTLNCSDALHLAIKGLLLPRAAGRETPVVVTTWMDHNSILRPLRALESAGAVRVERVRCDPIEGRVDPDDVRRVVRAHPSTALVAIGHASNVTGTVQPVGEIGRMCREGGVPLLVDAAQTLGHLRVDVEEMGIDLLAFPGHKGLLGPSGTGGLYLAPGMEQVVGTVREGGTGSRSEADVQPEELPDRYEAGSHNIVGLAGLDAALGWVLERGIETIAAHEDRLCSAFLGALASEHEPGGARLVGPLGREGRVAVFSLSSESAPPSVLAARLEQEHGVLCRAGLHCAPLAHRTIGTSARGGTTRLSFGATSSVEDAAACARAVLGSTGACVGRTRVGVGLPEPSGACPHGGNDYHA